MKLVCTECKYCLTEEEKSLGQCPNCGSSKLKKSFKGAAPQIIPRGKAERKKLFTIIGVIGIILMVAGVLLISFTSSLLETRVYAILYSIGTTFMIVGVILFSIAIAYARRKTCIC